MTTLLLRNADVIVPFDDAETTLTNASILVRDNVIEQVGPADAAPQTADTVIDVRGRILIPGLVNTHHHFYQTLTRNVQQRRAQR